MMLNPIIASLVYQSEMLISYIFYSNVSEKRKSSPKVWVIGFVLFELGAMANLLSGNNALINVCISVLVHVVFSIACFHIPIRIGAFYAVILMALSTALEFAMAMLISALMKSQPLDFSADPLLFIMECPASKLLYFIITMAISKAMNDQQYPRKMSLNILFFPIAMLMNLLVIFYVCVANQIASDSPVSEAHDTGRGAGSPRRLPFPVVGRRTGTADCGSYESPAGYILPTCEIEIVHLDMACEDAASQERAELETQWEIQEHVETNRITHSMHSGNEWDSPVEIRDYVSDEQSGCFRIIRRYFVEASEGHGARFAAMVDTFTVIPPWGDANAIQN